MLWKRKGKGRRKRVRRGKDSCIERKAGNFLRGSSSFLPYAPDLSEIPGATSMIGGGQTARRSTNSIGSLLLFIVTRPLLFVFLFRTNERHDNGEKTSRGRHRRIKVRISSLIFSHLELINLISRPRRGIGLAVTRFLLTELGAIVVGISRSRTPELEQLEQAHSSAGDLLLFQCDV